MVRKCIKEVKGDYFDYEEALISSGLLSSFDIYELIICIEDNFNIKIPTEMIEPEMFDSIDSIILLINHSK